MFGLRLLKAGLNILVRLQGHDRPGDLFQGHRNRLDLNDFMFNAKDDFILAFEVEPVSDRNWNTDPAQITHGGDKGIIRVIL